jgi:hypothetical protein
MQKIKMQTAKSFEIHRVCILHFAFCIQVVHFFSNLLGRGIQLAFWFRSEVVDGQVEQEGRDVRGVSRPARASAKASSGTLATSIRRKCRADLQVGRFR